VSLAVEGDRVKQGVIAAVHVEEPISPVLRLLLDSGMKFQAPVIGKDDAPPYLPSVMLAALSQDFRFSPIDVERDYWDNDVEEAPQDEYEDDDEGRATHPPVMPDVRPSTRTPPEPNVGEDEWVPAPQRPSRPTTKYEQKMKRWLKEYQYAYHCQACLATNEPAELAPKKSYSHMVDNRRHSMVAHHIRHRSARGPSRPWNSLVLCWFHHGLLGDRLTPKFVKNAIDKAKPTVRSWDGREVQGLTLSVSIPEFTDPVHLFFTQEHLRELERGG